MNKRARWGFCGGRAIFPEYLPSSASHHVEKGRQARFSLIFTEGGFVYFGAKMVAFVVVWWLVKGASKTTSSRVSINSGVFHTHSPSVNGDRVVKLGKSQSRHH